jgi:OFA family oxalate/formate antiporter-like MFS transporter
LNNRWLQLAAGMLSLMAVANFQYAWTLFVLPLEQRHGWSREAIQVAYTLFLLSQTWLVPLEAYLAERFGPRRLLLAGSVLVALAWVFNSFAASLAVLYIAQVLSGCGSGIIYSISMGNALKWFPDRRGLAAGLTAAAFGSGSAATVLPIRWTIENAGYETAFLWFGLGQGLVILLSASPVRFPREGEAPAEPRPERVQTVRDYTPREVLRSPAFWLLYVMMTAGAIPGLLMTSQLAPMAADFQIAKEPVALFGITFAALDLALMIDRIMGGLTRPVFGWFSDPKSKIGRKIGREGAMFIAFSLEGASLLLLILFARNPVMFVLMSGVAFFGWGAVFSLFPATAGDLFGGKHATTNYALLYTAKGMTSVPILLMNRLQAVTGSWVPVFAVMIAFDWLAALLALFALRPLRARDAAASKVKSLGEA